MFFGKPMPNGARHASRVRTFTHARRIDVVDSPEHRRTGLVVSLGIVPLGITCGTAAGAQGVISLRVRVGSAVQQVAPVQVVGAYIKKQHLHTRGAETDNRGTAQYGGMTSGAKPSTGALRQRRRPQQQRAQLGQAAEATVGRHSERGLKGGWQRG